MNSCTRAKSISLAEPNSFVNFYQHIIRVRELVPSGRVFYLDFSGGLDPTNRLKTLHRRRARHLSDLPNENRIIVGTLLYRRFRRATGYFFALLKILVPFAENGSEAFYSGR